MENIGMSNKDNRITMERLDSTVSSTINSTWTRKENAGKLISKNLTNSAT